jgi:ribosomal protein S27AE
MEKYGVDEGTDSEALEKSAAEGCPSCGSKPIRHGNVLICPKCGSEPFE